MPEKERGPADLLGIPQVQHCLDLAADVGRSCPVVDVHVHGTEVIFRRVEYRPPGEGEAVFSAVDRPVEPPRLVPLRLDPDPAVLGRFDAGARNRASRLLFSIAYQHIGHGVLLGHMDLARVRTALLLPVAPTQGPVTDQMEMLLALRGRDRRLPLAYSVPNEVPDREVSGHLEAAVNRYGVKAVKLHPNISGINLRTAAGMERVESILAACSATKLPLIVHGGRSPILENRSARQHAILQNLALVDWSRCSEAVVIAHFGVFGCERDEISGVGIPMLQRMLDRHENLLVDTSAAGFGVLCETLRKLDHERMVFGSDALYFPMWKAVVTLIHALRSSHLPVEESFARIACKNARTRLRLGADGV